MSAVEIRRLEPDDWAVWRAVRLKALREAPYAFGSAIADWQGAGDVEVRWRHRLEAVAFNVVAEVDGRAVGQASGTTPDASGDVGLISMWVAPEARGRGIGEALVSAVADWAADQGATAVVLEVKRTNAAAIALYHRLGFEPAPSRDDTSPDEQVMSRVL